MYSRNTLYNIPITPSYKQFTPMHFAFMNNNVQVIKTILYSPFIRQIDLLRIPDIYGNNPLHIATSLEGSQESVKACLTWAMDNNKNVAPVITARNNQFMTPLHLTLRNNFLSTAQALLNPIFIDDNDFIDIFQLPSQTTPIVIETLRLYLAIEGIYQKNSALESRTCSALHTLEILSYAMSPAVEINDSIMAEFNSALSAIRQQHFLN